METAGTTAFKLGLEMIIKLLFARRKWGRGSTFGIGIFNDKRLP